MIHPYDTKPSLAAKYVDSSESHLLLSRFPEVLFLITGW